MRRIKKLENEVKELQKQLSDLLNIHKNQTRYYYFFKDGRTQMGYKDVVAHTPNTVVTKRAGEITLEQLAQYVIDGKSIITTINNFPDFNIKTIKPECPYKIN